MSDKEAIGPVPAPASAISITRATPDFVEYTCPDCHPTNRSWKCARHQRFAEHAPAQAAEPIERDQLKARVAELEAETERLRGACEERERGAYHWLGQAETAEPRLAEATALLAEICESLNTGRSWRGAIRPLLVANQPAAPERIQSEHGLGRRESEMQRLLGATLNERDQLKARVAELEATRVLLQSDRNQANLIIARCHAHLSTLPFAPGDLAEAVTRHLAEQPEATP